METVCLENGRWLSHGEWKKMEEAYLCYRAAANKLAASAISTQLPRWRMRPKIHYLEHGIYDFGQKKLRYLSNYLDEDFIRRCKRIAANSNPRFLSRHVVYKYSVGATLRWSGMVPE